MDVDEAPFNVIISPNNVQFIIPVWQRLYCWEEKEWDDLWADLMNLYGSTDNVGSAEHYLGAIVVKTKEDKVGGVTKRILIDGQQRITTLLLICALLRDKAKTEHKNKLVDEIEASVLFNKYAKKDEDKLKLCPTEADYKAFNSIINGENSELSDYSDSQLYLAYKFFKQKLESIKDGYNIEILLSHIRNLRIVTINIKEKDNANRIFETLNFRGKKLTQSDLVRNYFMMAIGDESKEAEVYKDIWYPMQQNLGSDTAQRIKNLEKFLRHYVTMKKHSFIKEDEIYAEMRRKLKSASEKDIISELKWIRHYSKYYERLLDPNKEENAEIKRLIKRLNRLDITVHYPFLLKVYKAFKSNDSEVKEDDFCTVLRTIESYVVRRFAQPLPTNVLNKLFASLCSLRTDTLAESFQDKLAEYASWEAPYWPEDRDFKKSFAWQNLYSTSSTKCRFILEALEENIGHPEPVKFEGLTIEHIMPEKLNEEWKEYLGDNWKSVHNDYLHTIGNLTLIAGPKNSKLQNKLFSVKKKEWYAKSNVGLTQEIVKRWDKWTEAEIKERGNLIAEEAVKIWPHHK